MSIHVQVKVFQNWDKIQGKKSWYQKKGIIIMYLDLKYQSPNTSGSKHVVQVKVFRTRSKLKVTRSNVLVPKEWFLHNASISQV
jgi:hypothetical protein